MEETWSCSWSTRLSAWRPNQARPDPRATARGGGVTNLAASAETLVGVRHLQALGTGLAVLDHLLTVFRRPPPELAAPDRRVLPTADLTVSYSEISPADLLVDVPSLPAATQQGVMSSAIADATDGLIPDVHVPGSTDLQWEETARARLGVLNILCAMFEGPSLEV